MRTGMEEAVNVVSMGDTRCCVTLLSSMRAMTSCWADFEEVKASERTKRGR